MMLYPQSIYKHPGKETSYSSYSHYVFKKLIYTLIRYINLNKRKKANRGPVLCNLVSDPEFMDWSRVKITFLLKENKRNYIKVILVIRDPHSIKMQSNTHDCSPTPTTSSSYPRVNKKYKIKLGSILTNFKKK